jgi:hypothetical protein
MGGDATHGIPLGNDPAFPAPRCDEADFHFAIRSEDERQGTDLFQWITPAELIAATGLPSLEMRFDVCYMTESEKFCYFSKKI